MLNALVLGARELAGLTGPEDEKPVARFPSKLLAPKLHNQYIQDEDTSLYGASNGIQQLLEDISRKAIGRGREETEGRVPELVRERKLRITPRTRNGITELDDPSSSSSTTTTTRFSARTPPRANTTAASTAPPTFNQLAAEYFIGPMLSRFWHYLNDQLTREERTKHTGGASHHYQGTGTGLILNAMTLSHFVGSLAVMIYAARLAPAYLNVLAPDALELAVTLGTKRVSGSEDQEKGKDAAVLRACLELSITILDGCLELDGGRTLGLEYTALLMATSEWADKVFRALERGAKVLGGGGREEERLSRASAGLVLKVEEIRSKWRNVMMNGLF